MPVTSNPSSLRRIGIYSRHVRILASRRQHDNRPTEINSLVVVSRDEAQPTTSENDEHASHRDRKLYWNRKIFFAFSACSNANINPHTSFPISRDLTRNATDSSLTDRLLTLLPIRSGVNSTQTSSRLRRGQDSALFHVPLRPAKMKIVTYRNLRT